MSESIGNESGELQRTEASGRRFREAPLPSGIAGRLFLDEMPGRHGPLGDAWAAVEAARVSCIVCLAGKLEIEAKSPTYAAAIARGEVPCDRIECPIVDFGVPKDAASLRAVAESVAGRLRAGERVLVHCGAGRGRSGMFAICVLLVLGAPLEEASTAARQAKAGPETDQQEDFVRRFVRDGSVEA
jgi:Tyrosine phosphatase family